MDIFQKYPDLQREDFVERYDLENCHSRKQEALSELDVAVAIIRHNGNISAVAKAVGRTRNTVAGFVARTRVLSDLHEDIRESYIDELEEKHMQAALAGDLATQRFFLTTLGANRGYLKPSQVELSGRGGGPIETKDTSPRDRIAEKLASLSPKEETPSGNDSDQK